MQSAQHCVRGYIDAIQEDPDGSTLILDYKTSKKLQISPEYRLQLGIYALLREDQQLAADEVGIFFLKHAQELRAPVTPELVQNAREACANVQLKTKSDKVEDYPKKPGPLCKWSTGQCEFYDICFSGKTTEEYKEGFKK